MKVISSRQVSILPATKVNINKLKKPLLSLGSHHPDVVELQSLLARYVTPQVAGGIFDSATDYAVRVFQYRMFLEEDGIVGPQTWFALYTGAPVNMPVLRWGDRHPAVKLVQETLNMLGFGSNCVDGVLGNVTARSLANFQKHRGLAVDSVVGPSVWYALSKARFEDPTTPIICFNLHAEHQLHTGAISDIVLESLLPSVAVFPHIATASPDAPARQWNPKSGYPAELVAQTDFSPLSASRFANVVCFSPHGYKLAVASGPWVYIYSNQRHQLAVRQCPQAIQSLSFSANGRYLAMGCRDHNIYILDLRESTGKIVFTLKGHQASISAVVFSHVPSTTLVSVDESGRLIHWEVICYGSEECGAAIVNISNPATSTG